MKQSVLSVVALVVLSASTLTASAATSQAKGGSMPLPQAKGGSMPLPQAKGGSMPLPQSTFGIVITSLFAYLGF